jgi:hypothetical protein
MARRSINRVAVGRMLFVGNSFTARNDLPGLLAQLAIAPDGKTGRVIEHHLIQRGGASLRMHLNKRDAATAMRDESFDYVVLQEQSTLPIKNPTRMHENVREFDALIRAAGAKTVLYMTWARQAAPPDAQHRIADAYTMIGKEIGAIVVPAGLAWRAFLAKHKTPVLHDPDKSHPTLAGSYLAACTFHATLFGDAPPGETQAAEEIHPADRAALRRTAMDVARKFVAK